MKKGKQALLPQIVVLCIINTYLVLFVHEAEKLIVLGQLLNKLTVKISLLNSILPDKPNLNK